MAIWTLVLHMMGQYVWSQNQCRDPISCAPDTNARGSVREYVCSCADTWADMAMCHSTPLGPTSW